MSKIFLGYIAAILLLFSCSSNENLEKAKKLKKGMSKKQVIEIMGNPDSVGEGYYSPLVEVLNYKVSIVESEGVSLGIDSSSALYLIVLPKGIKQ